MTKLVPFWIYAYDSSLLQNLRKQFLNPVSGHGPSMLKSQELNLVDQDRFVRFLLTDSDPVCTALSI
jgi:hypothetical protein